MNEIEKKMLEAYEKALNKWAQGTGATSSLEAQIAIAKACSEVAINLAREAMEYISETHTNGAFEDFLKSKGVTPEK